LLLKAKGLSLSEVIAELETRHAQPRAGAA
jgi:phosphoribosyl-ATP pyrophosphohydrolase